MNTLKRLLTGLVFALPLALITFALTRTGSVKPVQAADELACQDCHSSIEAVWQQGAHGQALLDDVFQTQWAAQNKPKECLGCHTTGYDPVSGTYAAEGVTCAACHNPIGAGHPLSPAAMSRSADLCGECHRETYFEWQASSHGASDLTCVNCHDPHATDIKAADTSTLCAGCHGTRVAAYTHSAHATQGLTCTDCHIGAKEAQMGMGQSRHTHSFAVDLATCNRCHEEQLHNPSKSMLVNVDMTSTALPPDSGASGHPRAVAAEPEPASPIGYALFAGLIGLAFGIVLAPWLEKGIRLVTRDQRHEEVQS